METKKFSVEEGLKLISAYKRHRNTVTNGIDSISVNSYLTYRTFLNSGTSCLSCGLKASYFKITENKVSLQLIGLKEGKEIVFTKDHIFPKSKGGAASVENLQTMCLDCNTKKADKLMETIYDNRTIRTSNSK